MSEKSVLPIGRTSRRRFLSSVLAATAAAGGVSTALGQQNEDGYVVEQGGNCVPVTPLRSDRPVEAFYDYRNPYTDPSDPGYGSYGTIDLQKEETSRLFLYEGPNGLSLVLLHDKLNGENDGGSVTFELSGLPDSGEWAVEDDAYDRPTNYDTFERSDGTWTVDWTWSDARQDGGVYSGLGDEFEVTIDPAFNEEAELYDEYYTGTISKWQALSGDRESFETVPLDLDEPVTIRTGSCEGDAGTGGGDGSDSASGPVEAEMDVVPDRFDPRSRETVRVAVLSTGNFDATTIDPETVEFGPGDARPIGSGRQDANGDDITDQVFEFRIGAAEIGVMHGIVDLTAKTDDGRTVSASDTISPTPGEDREAEVEGEDDEGEDEDDEREDQDDDDDDEREDDNDDDENDEREKGGPGRGKGKGHDKGRGNGHDKGKGKGHRGGE